MVWLRAEMDNQDKSLLSMFWSIVCWQYETVCGPNNFSVQCISMKCVRPTFSGGRSSYIVISNKVQAVMSSLQSNS